MIKKSEYVTSAEASIILGFTHDHVRKLIKNGTIFAQKIGHNWIIEKKLLKNVRRQRFPRDKEILKDESSE